MRDTLSPFKKINLPNVYGLMLMFLAHPKFPKRRGLRVPFLFEAVIKEEYVSNNSHGFTYGFHLINTFEERVSVELCEYLGLVVPLALSVYI